MLFFDEVMSNHDIQINRQVDKRITVFHGV